MSENSFVGNASVNNPKFKQCKGFYFRCTACNSELNGNQQKYGLCTHCSSDVLRGCNPKYDEDDRYFMERQLWSNPQGSLEDIMGGDNLNDDYSDY